MIGSMDSPSFYCSKRSFFSKNNPSRDKEKQKIKYIIATSRYIWKGFKVTSDNSFPANVNSLTLIIEPNAVNLIHIRAIFTMGGIEYRRDWGRITLFMYCQYFIPRLLAASFCPAGS